MTSIATSLHTDRFAAIEQLKKERNAVILAHYYQDPDIQDVADFLGDSLALAQMARNTDAEVILFCGVHFMAETAKILNPDRRVLMPDLAAGCSLADSCPADAFARWKARYPQSPVVSYINCSAEVKALSDIICTSSNAVAIVESLPDDRPILFAPDRHLGAYVARQTGRELVLWPGSCQVHDLFSQKRVVQLKVQYPDALLIAHPECDESVLEHADFIGSTKALLDFTATSEASTFIVATEAGILHQMARRSPDKTFVPAPPESGCACNECPHMRVHTLDKVLSALRDLTPAIEVDPELARRALIPIERMLSHGAVVPRGILRG